MLDWLELQMHAGQDPTKMDIFMRIVAAMILGCVVACIYYFTHHRDVSITNGFISTLVLLSILLSMVVMAVGNNIARSFTLAGVLAIVRFRTVVKDTRDSAFVICAVVVGMAAGVGYMSVAFIGLPIVAIAAYFAQFTQPVRHARSSDLHLRFVLSNSLQTSIEEILKKYVEAYALKEAATCKKGTAIDLSYRVRFRKGMQTSDLLKELKALEGMQSVEWKI